MREVWRMWNYATMVVLTVLTAGLFAAILIPFKGIPLIPGLTELRPANVIPVVCGLLFGPAGAWGAAFGNLIGDFFGTLGIGSFFGFWGNFLAAYLTYKLWGDRPLDQIFAATCPALWPRCFWAPCPAPWSSASGWRPSSSCLSASSRWRSWSTTAWSPCILGPVLLRLLAPRVGRWDLAWREQMDPEDRPPGPAPRLGLVLVWLGAGGGYLAGLALGFGLVIIPGLPSLAVVLVPFVGLLVLGCFLL